MIGETKMGGVVFGTVAMSIGICQQFIFDYIN